MLKPLSFYLENPNTGEVWEWECYSWKSGFKKAKHITKIVMQYDFFDLNTQPMELCIVNAFGNKTLVRLLSQYRQFTESDSKEWDSFFSEYTCLS